jgi:single-stranded-DNA-specific exonuclease
MKWIISKPPDKKLVNEVVNNLKISTTIASILVSRGYDTIEKINKFIHPKIEDMHSPFLMRDMERAVSRIITAVHKKEKILIYGDYDVDGVTSVSLLYSILKKIGANVDYYIPHRLKEGYGLSEEGVSYSLKTYVNLIITVDCGIGESEKVRELLGNGIDVIITDHHESGAKLPNSVPVLDPMVDDYPFKQLSGCGVAFKLAQALYKRLGLSERDIFSWLDITALSTVADVMPIIEENRVITKYGLLLIEKTKKPGLQALLKVSGLANKKLNTYHIGFILGPRINAQGRLGEASEAVKLLITRDRGEAAKIAKSLDEENRKRIAIQENIVKEAEEIVQKTEIKNLKGIVLASDEWHPGVIGIAASRVAEKYYRPTVLIAIEDNIGKGSARSIPKFHLLSALRECEDSLISLGGHKLAAGLTIERANIEEFKKKFNKIAENRLKEDDLIPGLNIDIEIPLKKINQSLLNEIKTLSPYGLGNPVPTFITRNVQIIGYPKVVGNNHLKFKVREIDKQIRCIAFNLGNLYPQIDTGVRVDIVYQVKENEWLGEKKLQLNIKNIIVNHNL